MTRRLNALFACAAAAALASPLALADNARSASDATPGASTPQATPAQTFARLDTNNDGYISRAEAGLAPDIVVIFPVADTDKDDRLSQGELDEGMKKQAARGGSGSASQGSSRSPGGEGVYSPQGPAGGNPLGSAPAGRAGSGASK